VSVLYTICLSIKHENRKSHFGTLTVFKKFNYWPIRTVQSHLALYNFFDRNNVDKYSKIHTIIQQGKLLRLSECQLFSEEQKQKNVCPVGCAWTSCWHSSSSLRTDRLTYSCGLKTPLLRNHFLLARINALPFPSLYPNTRSICFLVTCLTSRFPVSIDTKITREAWLYEDAVSSSQTM
jgi:hypothetical protein